MPGSEKPLRLSVRVIPRAKRNEVGSERGGRLLVRVTAPPVDEQANQAVCRLIAAHLGVPVRRVEVVSSHHSRDKVVIVGG